jgi:hypothetical protein
VANELYQSEWTEVPIKFKKCLWVVMMKAQIPLEIEAFSSKLNLEQLQNTVNAAYGYVTYLQSIKN